MNIQIDKALNSSKQRRFIIEVLGCGCADCGDTKSLVIHHRDENKHNNRDDNLTVLCRHCHKVLHWAYRKDII